MNVVDLVESARPDVDPMPLDQRRMVRERLFGAADDVVKTTIRERSSSGAVTSTAPPGYRARRVRSRPSRPKSSGSFAKMGAGLLVLGAAGAAGWSWYADGDEGDVVSLTPSTVVTTTTVAPTTTTTTTLPPTRTGVSETEPVLFPLGLIPIDEAVIDIAPANGEYVLLRAGDATWLRLEVIEGDAAPGDGLDFETIGAIDVAPFAFGPEAPWIYVIGSDCGSVRVIDAPAQEQFRPVVAELFEGMSVDANGGVDGFLPDGLRVIDAASGEQEYRTVFRFEDEDGGEAQRVTFRQVPGGSIAQLVPGGAQPSEMVWLGEPALGDGDLIAGDDETGPVAVYWRDADTVFAISSETVPVDELENFVSGLRAATISSWSERFSATEIDSTVTFGTQPDEETGEGENPGPACAPQPSLGPTFLP